MGRRSKLRPLEQTFVLLAFLGLFSCSPAQNRVSQDWDAIVAEVATGVVSITAWKPLRDQQFPLNMDIQVGSGIVYRSDGLILTNQHVVRDAAQIRVEFAHGQQSFMAEIMGGDDRSDIAVLRLLTDRSNKREREGSFHELEWARSSEAKVGEPVLAIGNPYGFSHSASSGVLSSIERVAPLGGVPQGQGAFEADSVLQTDAAIHPGSSGGPLLNRRGEVLGLTTLFFSRTGEPSGIAFAIPSDRLRYIADQLISNGRVRRSWLGVSAQDVEPGLSIHLGGYGSGVLITDVGPFTPAGGTLQSGDLILMCNGTPTHRLLDFREKIQRSSAGTELELTLIRRGQLVQRRVRPMEWMDPLEKVSRIARHGSVQRAGQRAQVGARSRAPFLGMQLGRVPESWARGVRYDGSAEFSSALRLGAKILSIDPLSPAWSAGLFPGDWILEINGQPISGPEAVPVSVSNADFDDIVLTIRQGGPRGPKLYRWISKERIGA